MIQPDIIKPDILKNDEVVVEELSENEAEIEKYIEIEMPHRTDTKCGYDRIYTSGSKKWLFTR